MFNNLSDVDWWITTLRQRIKAQKQKIRAWLTLFNNWREAFGQAYCWLNFSGKGADKFNGNSSTIDNFNVN